MAVRKRKDTGSWVCDFYYNGKRIVRTLKFARTKKQAEQAEAVIKNEVFKQAYELGGSRSRRGFEDFIVEHFFPYSEANKRSFRDDVYICRRLVQEFRNRRLDQIRSDEIESYKQLLFSEKTVRGTKRKAATVNRHLAVLSRVFSLAIEADFIDTNPCNKVRRLSVDNMRMRVLSRDEETRLLGSLQENTLVRHIVVTALNTGLRRGEIFDLRWESVDLDRRIIVIERSKSNKKRIVPMNSRMLRLFAGIDQDTVFVFPSPRSNGRLDNIKKSFNSATKQAGIEDLTFHDLRHTAASRMAESGVDPFTLARILGHSDIRMTNRYTHASDDSIRSALETLAQKA